MPDNSEKPKPTPNAACGSCYAIDLSPAASSGGNTRSAPIFVIFVCIDRQLVIEVDGGQHATEIVKDETRTAYLESKGITHMRFWNHGVLTETKVV